MVLLFLIEELGGGGKERRMVELLKALSKSSNNYQIHLTLTKPGLVYNQVNQLNIEIHLLTTKSNLGLIKGYKNHINLIKPDIIHAWSYKTAFYAALLKPFFNFKLIAGYISNVFGHSPMQKIFANHLIYKNSNAIVGNSKTGLESYNAPNNKSHVIYNGFDFNRFNFPDNENELKKIGVKTNYTIVMLANVTNKKDYKTFVKVAEKFIKNRNDITFLSIGKIDSSYDKVLERYINNTVDNIRFLGYSESPERIIKKCDIGVLFTFSEGVSNAILEYMAAGLPVVTTDRVGGSKELVCNNETGFICSNENVFEKIELLLENEKLRIDMGVKGIEKVKSEFSLKKMTDEYINLYEKVT